MADTLIDYDKTNEYLPNTLRQFVGATNRIVVQDFETFYPMFEGIEQLAVFNNKIAADFASGFTQLNYIYLRSGVAPKLLDIFTSKTCGRVWYQAENENEVEFDSKFNRDYFSGVLYKATFESAMTGRSIMVLYGSKNEIEVGTYNLFRHRIFFDNKKNVVEAFIYLANYNVNANIRNVVCEHRFYKNVKDKVTNVETKVPYQEFIVYSLQIDSVTGKAKTNEIIPSDQLSKELLDKYPNIEFNRAKKLDFPTIGVYDLKYTSVNKKFLDSDVPEAMFIDAIDNAVTIDTSITGKEVEKEVGRGQVLLPEFEQGSMNQYITQAGAGERLMRSLTISFKEATFKKYPSRSIEDSKPTNVQFDIRSEQWNGEIDNDTARLCENVGIGVIDYCPRLLGGMQRTDDEINAMTDITANTVKAFRNLNQEKINQMLTAIANTLGLNYKVSIRWSMASILNPTKNTALVTQQLSAGLISRKEAIRRINPDLNEKEISDLYNEIMAERGAEATENRFDSF